MRVIVVGAGIVGYAVAYELAARGAQVRVIDRRGTGRGATHASAGMLAPYIEGHAAPLLQLGVCSLEQYEGFVRRIAGEGRRAVEYRHNGTLQVARDESEVRPLERLAGTLREAGVSHSWLDAGGTRRLEPALGDGVQAGLVVPLHGYVGVATLMAALVDAATSHGVTCSIRNAYAIASANGAPSVETDTETLTADAVIVAAGCWSGGITMKQGPAPPVRPIRGQLVHLRLEEPPVSRVIWGGSAYLVPWQDGSVLVGATVEDVGFDERVTSGGVRQLRDSAEQLVPALRSATFVEARAGLRPRTADELPIIGPSSTMRGVYYATGHYRNGVLLAPLTATMIADLLIDGRERREAHLVRPDRFGL